MAAMAEQARVAALNLFDLDLRVHTMSAFPQTWSIVTRMTCMPARRRSPQAALAAANGR
jgi:hypothetical protein